MPLDGRQVDEGVIVISCDMLAGVALNIIGFFLVAFSFVK